jgi:hypothetical protein
LAFIPLTLIPLPSLFITPIAPAVLDFDASAL